MFLCDNSLSLNDSLARVNALWFMVSYSSDTPVLHATRGLVGRCSIAVFLVPSFRRSVVRC